MRQNSLTDTMRDLIKKILKEELKDITGTPLYHITTSDSAIKIIDSNSLIGTLPTEEYLELDKRLNTSKNKRSISLTRDKNFKGDQSLGNQTKNSMDVTFILDSNKLKTRYKVEPFNYSSLDPQDKYTTKNLEYEERVLTDRIHPLNDYLIDIIYTGNNPKIKERIMEYKKQFNPE